jgi:hypothetical protein
VEWKGVGDDGEEDDPAAIRRPVDALMQTDERSAAAAAKLRINQPRN